MGISAEIFTHQKTTFRERIAKLVGGTTYREPVGGRSTDPHRMTDQDVAAALAYARKGQHDIGPDVAYCILCQSDWHRARIVKALAEALFSSGGHWARKARPYLLTIADDAYRVAVHQQRPQRPEDCHLRAYEALLVTGISTLATLADESILRAERAFSR